MAVDPRKMDEINTRGFTVVPGVVTEADALEMRGLLARCVEEDLRAWAGRPYPDAWMVHNLMVRGLPFARLMENETIQAYACELLGPTCIVYAYTSSSMPPGGANFSSRIHVDSPRLIPGYVTNVGVMVALDDFTPLNGATYFLPGSHTRAVAPDEGEFHEKAERVYPPGRRRGLQRPHVPPGREK